MNEKKICLCADRKRHIDSKENIMSKKLTRKQVKGVQGAQQDRIRKSDLKRYP